VEDWNDGIMEGWCNEIGKEVPFSKPYFNIPSFHYSNIPVIFELNVIMA
jgi:hypothetical protein